MSWLPDGFRHPDYVEITNEHHLRPIRATDAPIDYPAVMGSRAGLWKRYGDAWGWPPTTMTFEQDRADLARHEHEMEIAMSFNYAVLPTEERELLGCVYIDPTSDMARDATVSWWLIDQLHGSALDKQVERFIPDWLASAWPFDHVHYEIA